MTTEKTRETAYPGASVGLWMHVRDLSNKTLVGPHSINDVRIFNSDPGRVSLYNPCIQIVKTLKPTLVSPGTYYTRWDIPTTLIPGKYYDQWSVNMYDGSTPTNLIKVIIVGEPDIYLSEDIPLDDLKIECLTGTLIRESKDFVVFKLVQPEGILFPKAEAKIVKYVIKDVEYDLTKISDSVVVTNNALNSSTVLLPTETLVEYSFFPLDRKEDKAYFYFDTTDVTLGIYYILLKVYWGNSEKIFPAFKIKLEEL